jgi:hypothetical protein
MRIIPMPETASSCACDVVHILIISNPFYIPTPTTGYSHVSKANIFTKKSEIWMRGALFVKFWSEWSEICAFKIVHTAVYINARIMFE